MYICNVFWCPIWISHRGCGKYMYRDDIYLCQWVGAEGKQKLCLLSFGQSKFIDVTRFTLEMHWCAADQAQLIAHCPYSTQYSGVSL